ncbi:hypothetical protein U1769_05050 [Sphingomonas sp. ZT3P38]|uniref:hypothetical protein n=1 Tax=Parasphingomonas zepuensis TaxID=3096161 RepID=UPI002FCC20F1
MKKTVFVVGAAGSTEFDNTGRMPIGSALAVQIEALLDGELTNRDGPISNALMRNGGLTDVHLTAMAQIRSGIHSRDSIDQFIDDRSDSPYIAMIAKLCIAHLILTAERSTALHVPRGQTGEGAMRSLRQTWLSQVLRRSNEPMNRQRVLDCLADVAFVTFNYDRCIEQFILLSVAATCALSLSEAAKIAAQVPVHHVYGSLGDIFDPAGNKVPFGSDDIWSISHGASRIRTFTEEMESTDAPHFQACLRDADNIVCLGMAYHSQNLRLLFPDGSPNGSVYGTTLGLRPRALGELSSFFQASAASTRWIAIKCSEFVEEIGDDIFPA